MAKAFTKEEKLKIKEKITETALDLFHDKGTKSLNIRINEKSRDSPRELLYLER